MSVLRIAEERAANAGVGLLTLVGAVLLLIAALVIVFSAMAGNFTPMLMMTLPVFAGGCVLWAIAVKSNRLGETVALTRFVIIFAIAIGVCFLSALFALVGVSVVGLLTETDETFSGSVFAMVAGFFAMFGWVPFLNYSYELADFKDQHVRSNPPKQLGALFWWVLASFPVAVFWAVLWGVLVGAAIVTPIHW